MGYGQRYVKYDIMGREIFNRRLPDNYYITIFHTSMDNAANGHLHFLRSQVALTINVLMGKMFVPCSDVIAEVDQERRGSDEWRLFDILDPIVM